MEYNEFFKSIRTGEFINNGPRMIHSTMMVIMGQMSAHTGKSVTWDEALAAKEDLFPNEEALTWSQSFKPNPVAIPGVTQIDGIAGVEEKA